MSLTATQVFSIPGASVGAVFWCSDCRQCLSVIGRPVGVPRTAPPPLAAPPAAPFSPSLLPVCIQCFSVFSPLCAQHCTALQCCVCVCVCVCSLTFTHSFCGFWLCMFRLLFVSLSALLALCSAVPGRVGARCAGPWHCPLSLACPYPPLTHLLSTPSPRCRCFRTKFSRR